MPTEKQREWLASASYVNSRELGEEAMILLREGRLPRAAFLAVESFEEWLKGRYCERGSRESDEHGFHAVFRSHPKKMALVKEFAEEGEWPAETVDVLLRMRERCLYVEVGDHGQALTPNGLVDPGEMEPEFVEQVVTWTRAQVVKRIELAASGGAAIP